MAVEAARGRERAALTQMTTGVAPIPRDGRRCAETLPGARRHQGAGVQACAETRNRPAFGAR